ncbi:ABC transporter permease, partial [Methylobacterium sp. WL103]
MANVAPVVAPRAGRASRFGWAGLGLLLPLILALGWEAAVRAGLAQGRL